MAGKKTNTSEPRLNNAAIQTSSYGVPIAIGWGTFRCTSNLIWMGSLQSKASTTKTSGGKGGGSKSTSTTYTYSASVLMGMCEGPISSVYEVFKDQSHFVDGTLYSRYSAIATALSGAGSTLMAADYTTLSTAAASINTTSTTALQSAGLNLALGNLGQSAQSFLPTGQQIGYSQTAYAYAQNYSLSSSATLSNHTLVVSSATRAVIAGVTLDDAHPGDIITDFLTNSYYGLPGWGSSLIGDLTEYRNACTAYGLFLSPVLDSQRTASDFLREVLDASNSDAYWSEGVLKIRPYADSALTANGITFTPNLTPVYSLGDDDFILDGNNDPIEVILKSPADAFNYVQIEYIDRTHQYNSSIAPAYDQGSIDQYGLRKEDPKSLKCVTMPSVAHALAQIRLQNTANVRMTFKFGLPEPYCLLEPMDLVQVTDSIIGLSNKLCRVTEIDEAPDGSVKVTAVEMLVGASSAPSITRQAPIASPSNYDVTPGNVSNPLLINPPRSLTVGGGYEVWLAASGGTNWGGAEVWVSFDGTNYQKQGVINAPARYGVLTANLGSVADPDTTSTLAVNLAASLGTLSTATNAAADAGSTLCLIDSELINYGTATLTGSNTYNLSYLRRGQNATSVASHSSGATFVRLDDALLRFSYNSSQSGQTLYVKFLSFNGYGRSVQALSDVSAYTLTLNPGSAPTLPIAAASLSGSATVNWGTQVTGTGKPADNADVTATHTAAAITGQGALATASSASWASQVSGRPANISSLSGSEGILNSAISSTDANTSNLLRRTSGGLFTGELAADQTSIHTASSISGQGALATQSSLAYGGSYLTGFGTYASKSGLSLDDVSLSDGSSYYRYPAGDKTKLSGVQAGADVTSTHTAAAISGQGSFATLSSVGYGSSYLTGFGGLAPLSYVTTSSNQIYSPTYGYLADSAIYTPIGTAAAITGQGSLATQNNVNLSSQVSGLLGTGNAASGLINANVPVGSNAILNSEMVLMQPSYSNTYPIGFQSSWGGDSTNSPSFTDQRITLADGTYAFQRTAVGSPNGTIFDILDSLFTAPYLLPCKYGDNIGASALLSFHNCIGGYVKIIFFNKTLNELAEYNSSFVGTDNGSNTYTSLTRSQLTLSSVIATAPANTAYAGLFVRVGISGSPSNPSGIAASPMLAILAPNQTAVPPYSPGPAPRTATIGATTGTDLYSSTYGTLTDGGIYTPLGTAAAISGQAWAATNGYQSIVDNSYAAIGQNLIPNSDQTQKCTWINNYNPNGATVTTPALAISQWTQASASFALQGNTTRNVYVRQDGIATGTADGSGDTAVAVDLLVQDGNGNNVTIPVTPGQTYIASAYLANLRCKGAVWIGFVNSSGSTFSFYQGNTVGPTNNICYSLVSGQYARSSIIAVAPTGSVTAYIFVRKYNTLSGNSDSYLWIAAPMFEAANSNATGPSPYQPGTVSDTRVLGFTGETNADYTGSHTAAAISGQGALATQSNVNLGSQVTGTLGTGNASSGLINSNITIASNGALSGAGGGNVTIGGLGYTGELNADYTASHTASSIAGQGALATKSQTDTSDIVSQAVTQSQLFSWNPQQGSYASIGYNSRSYSGSSPPPSGAHITLGSVTYTVATGDSSGTTLGLNQCTNAANTFATLLNLINNNPSGGFAALTYGTAQTSLEVFPMSGPYGGTASNYSTVSPDLSYFIFVDGSSGVGTYHGTSSAAALSATYAPQSNRVYLGYCQVTSHGYRLRVSINYAITYATTNGKYRFIVIRNAGPTGSTAFRKDLYQLVQGATANNAVEYKDFNLFDLGATLASGETSRTYTYHFFAETVSGSGSQDGTFSDINIEFTETKR